jgi:maltose alpha-D-glucosyltransferase/alpha-amylase
MSWYNNAIYYELYPKAFADGNGDGHGDFQGLRDRLEYLQWLGIDCVWMTPIYPSPLRDDGYDISSFYGVSSKFGHLEDFRMLVDEMHRRGIRLIMDLVVNHTSDQHPWFVESRRSKSSPLRDWYVWSETPDKYQDTRIIFVDTEPSNWTLDPTTGEYYWHRFFRTQPDLNFDNPAVRAEMLRIIKFWLDAGIDGFRVDAVPYLIEREGTNNENLPETHEVLAEWRKFVDTHYPGTVMLAEANQWPKDLIPYFGTQEDPEFNVCFHFPVMPRLYKALAVGDRSCVVDILNETPPLPPGTQWATFLRNHDELTLEMVTPEDRHLLWDTYAPEPRQRLNLGIRRRLAPLMENDQRKIRLMNSMLFTLPGVPVLYYGDEIGMGDNIWLEDRNGVRTPMQWNASANGGFSDASGELMYSPTIDDAVFGYEQVNVESQKDDPDSLLNFIRSTIQARKRLPLLASGTLEWLDDLPKHILGFERVDGGMRMMALHNLSAAEVTIPLPRGRLFTDAFTGDGAPIAQEVTLPPYGFRWLSGQRPPM